MICRGRLRLALNAICICACVLSMLALGGVSAWNWVSYWRLSGWARVEGNLTRVNARNTCANKRDVPPESGQCCELEAEYTYCVAGKQYTGSGIGTERFGSPEVRSRRYAALKQAKAEGRPVDVWINPGNPAESALFRTEIEDDWYFGIALPFLVLCFAGFSVVRKSRNA